MPTLIIYYSRTETTRWLATVLAKALGADVAEVRCKRYQGGILRYLLAGYDSVKGNLPRIEAPPIEQHKYALVVICTPIWTSHPSLPIRAFLASKPQLPRRIALALTYGGHSPPGRAIEELAEQLPHPHEASLSLKETQMRDGTFASAVDSFVAKLEHIRSI